MDPILIEVKREIEKQGLTLAQASESIGVTSPSLKRHLEGEYVRSDSLAKYRTWLSRKARKNVSAQLQLIETDEATGEEEADFQPLADEVLFEKPSAMEKPYLVVDLFSGCGGMSLGFDLYEDGTVFQTVLALDIDAAMVRAFNKNQSRRITSGTGVCRLADLSQFLNETEVLAFYLDHLHHSGLAPDLASLFASLPLMGLQEFKGQVAELDSSFLARLTSIRNSPAYKREYLKLTPHAVGQTSVVGFHHALSLPMTSATRPVTTPLIWSAFEPNEGGRRPHIRSEHARMAETPLSGQLSKKLKLEWDEEVYKLRAKAKGSAKGQLASSARRVAAFVDFLDTPAMAEVREAWVTWRSARDCLRLAMFDSERTQAMLRKSYSEGHRVDILLGGPPCQGFSRIGRGKLRSLRENSVHVHDDPESGDVRNRLFYKYVLFLGALAPRVFLFENVRHFQARVKTSDGVFRATDLLADAIRAISRDELNYRISMRTIDSSHHLVPQARERFFMVGLRSDVVPPTPGFDLSAWCHQLPRHGEIPLRIALEGLPEPHWIGGEQGNGADLSETVRCTSDFLPETSPHNIYKNWIAQASPSEVRRGAERLVDSHHARLPRVDDRAFFELLGPGKRWMDYRCDGSETLAEIVGVLKAVRHAVEGEVKRNRGTQTGRVLKSLDINRVERLVKILDGSLSLRLLLECLKPRQGELRHHLITDNYLAKRGGNHGDWLARLSASGPCKTIMSHMAKDTYSYVHPYEPRTLSVREAARIQSFPDWFSFAGLGFVDALRIIGNAVPPLLSFQFAQKIARVLFTSDVRPLASEGHRRVAVASGPSGAGGTS